MKYEHDRALCISEGYRQGIEEGILQGEIKGISQGSYQKALETARLMKQANCEFDFIIRMTGLSQKEIEAL